MESSVSSSRHHAIYFVREPGGLESDTREKLAHNSKSPSPASNEIMNPSDVPTEMTSKRRRLLQPASEKLQVLAAINNGFHTLQFVSEELRSDREVILAAVNKYGPCVATATVRPRSRPGCCQRRWLCIAICVRRTTVRPRSRLGCCQE